MEETINKHQCLSCCLKHMASALVLAGEIKTGYDTSNYHMYLLGNLAEAQEQVSISRPKLANEIRNIRLDIFGDGGVANINDLILLKIRKVADNLKVAIAEMPIKVAAARSKNCNCQKRTPSSLQSKGG